MRARRLISALASTVSLNGRLTAGAMPRMPAARQADGRLPAVTVSPPRRAVSGGEQPCAPPRNQRRTAAAAAGVSPPCRLSSRRIAYWPVFRVDRAASASAGQSLVSISGLRADEVIVCTAAINSSVQNLAAAEETSPPRDGDRRGQHHRSWRPIRSATPSAFAREHRRSSDAAPSTRFDCDGRQTAIKEPQGQEMAG